MDNWYAGMYVVIVTILTAVLIIPIVLYYGFGISLPMPSIR